MDHMMSGMDGIETMLKIRDWGTEYAKKIPIIALTANATIGNEEMFLSKGFQAFLTKPIDIPRLDEVIRHWVRDKTKEKDSMLLPVREKPGKKTAAALPEIQGVDTRKGLRIYAGDMDIYLSVLRAYAENTPATINKLRIVTAETLGEYAIKAHALKGSSASIGAEDIRERAEDLETMANNGDLHGILKLNDALLNDAEILAFNVKTWLENRDKAFAKTRLAVPSREVLEKLRQSLADYDMSGIDNAMDVLESTDYDSHADLIIWLKNKITQSEFDEAAVKIAETLETL
jgi:CheY-like chemotaxis protein